MLIGAGPRKCIGDDALLDFPLAFPLTRVALPLLFHNLLPILGISLITLPPPFPLPCQSLVPILRIGGRISCPLARAKFLRCLTLPWRHVERPSG